MMKSENHVFQGMSRDTHQIKQDAKFLWDAHNIRLTNREDSTLLTITNEKGTLSTGVSFEGDYVGHCVIGKYLVVFTANKDWSNAHIYRVEKTEEGYRTIILFHEYNVWEEGWNPEYPIETLGVYETELIQKVYWIDGKHQPRVINITRPELKIPEEILKTLVLDNIDFSNPTGVLRELFPDGLYTKSLFDFSPKLNLKEKIGVIKHYGSGEFSPGTIQYALSYFNKYEQESNIFYTTPIYYISNRDKAVNEENKVANYFEIIVDKADENFDYIRIYSIHRTTLDATPTIKVVANIEVTGPKVTYMDYGISGYTITDTQLLYVGGKDLIPKTMTAKDNTLFFGNYELKEESYRNKIEGILNKYKGRTDLFTDFTYSRKHENTSSPLGNFYWYEPDLSNDYSATFKIHETYRCGIQVQDASGTWSSPFFLDDKVLSNPPLIPEDEYRTIFTKQINPEIVPFLFNELKSVGVKAVRTCVVFPKTAERDIICQGVVCPTVFSYPGRRDNSPYVQSSWFFRPACNLYEKDSDARSESSNTYNGKGARIEYRDNRSLFYGNSRGAEIQNMKKYADSNEKDVGGISANRIGYNLSDPWSEKVNTVYNPYHFVDENIVTFHSPDIEINQDLYYSIENKDVHLRIIGIAEMGAVYGDINVMTSSPAASPDAYGFIHKTVGYNTAETISSSNIRQINGGLVADTLYHDSRVNFPDHELGDLTYFMVYPWQRSGSLNSDFARNDGSQRTAVLSKKQISNFKFFNKNSPIYRKPFKQCPTEDVYSKPNEIEYEITEPKLFNSNELSITQIETSRLPNQEVIYFGNVDTAITTGYNGQYYIYGNPEVRTADKGKYETSPSGYISSEPVRMKYKSTPHLIFSLKRCTTSVGYNENSSEPYYELLPRCINTKIQDSDGIITSAALNTEFEYAKYYYQNWDYSPSKNVPTAVDYYADILGIFSNKEDYDAAVKHYLYQEIEDARRANPEVKLRALIGRNSNNAGYGCYRIKADNSLETTPENPNELVGKILRGYGSTVMGLPVSVSEGQLTEEYIFPNSNITDYEEYGLIRDTAVGERGLYRLKEKDKSFFYTVTTNEGTGENAINLSYNSAATDKQNDSIKKTNLHHISQRLFSNNWGTDQTPPLPYLLLAELINNNPATKFGGNSKEALQQNLWLPASEPVNIEEALNHQYSEDSKDYALKYLYGDTWYSRYDCLKTYAFTPEDENQVVEIGSFMCETRVNLDGRWDDNLGKLSHLVTSPTNFNHINTVYSQYDNYFNYRILDDVFYKNNTFPNQVTWSLEKHNGEEIDSWTNILDSNTVDLLGNNGNITALETYNDTLLCFQDKAVNQLLFNNRVQIPVSDGVPIEISNGFKMQGYRPISENVGCQNKWSIANSELGVYFVDNYTNTAWLYSGKLDPISDNEGMKWWFQDNNTDKEWSALKSSTELNGLRTFYDPIYNDVYFTPGPDYKERDALCYSEKLRKFTSQMSYGGTHAMFPMGNSFLSLRQNNKLTLYENFKGPYNNFFDTVKGWDFSFISNDNPTYTKIFDTIDIRTDHWNNDTLINSFPMNYLRVSNEYQDTQDVAIDNKNMRKKFRVWRGIIPRNSGTRERIRNLWTMIKLGYKPNSENSNKAVVHDVTVNYTV